MSRWLMLFSITFFITLLPLSLKAQSHYDDWEGIRLINGLQVVSLPAESLEVFDFLAQALDPQGRILSAKALENIQSEPLNFDNISLPFSHECRVMMSQADAFGNFSLFLNIREPKGALERLGNSLAGRPNQSFLEIPISAEEYHEKIYLLDYYQRADFKSEPQTLEEKLPQEYKIHSENSVYTSVRFHTGIPALNIFPTNIQVLQVGSTGSRTLICQL